MALICLPCEIYQREFDAKLLLATRLASEYGHMVLIGYDKYFTHAIPTLGPALLLEKSLSRIMLKGRIAPCKRLGGRVIVSDEEGINNVGIRDEETWLARVDPKAAELVDIYACWGTRDAQFFSKVDGLKKKMLLLGNCRSDLLNQIGVSYYHHVITAIKELFGEFILVSDNFALEKIGYQGMPQIAADMKSQKRLQIAYEQRRAESHIRRSHFTALLQHTVESLPSQQFVIRPHPRSHPRWWHEHFGAYRNVQVINRYAVEPWIHAAFAVVSMGCTTGLQALVAGKRVLEVTTPSLTKTGLVSHLMSQHFTSGDEVVTALMRLRKNQDRLLHDKDELRRSWTNINRSSTQYIARACHKLAESLPKNKAACLPRIDKLQPDSSKWSENPSTSEVRKRITRATTALNCSAVNLAKVSAGVWLITD